jgi:hypothetical protein
MEKFLENHIFTNYSKEMLFLINNMSFTYNIIKITSLQLIFL